MRLRKTKTVLEEVIPHCPIVSLPPPLSLRPPGSAPLRSPPLSSAGPTPRDPGNQKRRRGEPKMAAARVTWQEGAGEPKMANRSSLKEPPRESGLR